MIFIDVDASVRINLDQVHEIYINLEKLSIKFVIYYGYENWGRNNHYIKSFSFKRDMKDFIEKYLDNKSNENIKTDIKADIEELKSDMQEIKDMIKYMPHGKAYHDAKEDFEDLSNKE